MSVAYNPKIVTNGMILYLDAANVKSYPGAGTSWSNLVKTNSDGTLIASPTYNTDNLGHFDFNGSTQYVTLSNESNFDIDIDEPVSYCCWLKIDTAATFYFIYYKGNHISGGLPATLFQIDSSERIALRLINSGGALYTDKTSSSTVSVGEWTFVAGTYDGSINASGINIYKNGENAGAFSSSSTYSGTVLTNETPTIASRQTTAGKFYFDGKIALFSMYNRELTATEVKQVFNATRGRFGL